LFSIPLALSIPHLDRLPQVKFAFR